MSIGENKKKKDFNYSYTVDRMYDDRNFLSTVMNVMRGSISDEGPFLGHLPWWFIKI